MTDFSNAVESSIIQHIIAEATWAAPTTVYVQIHNGDPGEDGTANIIASVGGRKLASFAAESGGSASTDADLEWTNGTGGSITVSHISTWTLITGGICTMVGDLTSSKVVPDTEVFRIPSGSLTLSAS